MQTISYSYQKERRDFGRPCQFQDKSEMVLSIPSNKEMFKDYILRNPVDRATQLRKEMSFSTCNTESVEFDSKGIMHTEGGWPKDVNPKDGEQTVRYKRKIEKDENYINQVMSLAKHLEGAIHQNNAVNIYELYFDGLEPPPLMEKCSSRTVNVYRDPSPNKRPVTHMSWSPDNGTKIAIAHCDTGLSGDKTNATSYVWEVENPNKPLYTLTAASPSLCLEYHQKETSFLISGQFNGQVSAWDVRASKEPVMMSEREVSHRAQVNTVLWVNSKSGTEFFSGSSDGQVIWWDIRRPDEPMEQLCMDPQNTNEQDINRSYGISTLEYECSMPARFMAGTEQGMLFGCNRKGKCAMEKIQLRMQCHTGPIYSLARNPSFVKNFLTVGDWVARIWSEDCRESSIIWTRNHSHMLTDGCWSPTKCSLFYISRMDGILDAWDLLQQQNDPTLSIKVCDEPIRCLRPHDNGSLIGVGGAKGVTYLLEVSDNLSESTNKNDKLLLTAMLERENKRERILESKVKELKLKIRAQEREAEQALKARHMGQTMKSSSSKAMCEQAEHEYLDAVAAERQLREKDPHKHMEWEAKYLKFDDD
uniref:CSON007193 protein n=1 Tax=Culicoides sonorensis TaxID=179676 RepID=A0A336MZX5_CULSO